MRTEMLLGGQFHMAMRDGIGACGAGPADRPTLTVAWLVGLLAEDELAEAQNEDQ